ncbi:hypothetical protein BJF79_09415 [Actinomadura sp. CNU-125]|nr:FGGY family carbohydrate kinase [Actinomadura sp. CNU-125]OLT30801.1 hypothetical protein BJF79_09415 [Actinomadura sp. CNU-125]
MGPFVLAIDQGTGSTKALLVDSDGAVAAQSGVQVGARHPGPGLVEQDAGEVLGSVHAAVAACMDGIDPASVAGIGLSTQRESVVLWEAATGRPVAPLVGWQDRRGAARAAELADEGHADLVRQRTGLPLDTMFSALKMAALLDEHDPARIRSRRGDLRLGTVDAWLLARLTGAFVTEIGNASRTQLLNLRSGDWDAELLELFNVPREALPDVVSSTGPFGEVGDLAPLSPGVPVLAVLGDSHAALFAHAGWRRGVVKVTYGTGSSVMSVTDAPRPGGTLCDTIAWSIEGAAYANEANIRSSGRTLTWLAELLGVSTEQIVDMAAQAESGDVAFVPAFGGLGAPGGTRVRYQSWPGSTTAPVARSSRAPPWNRSLTRSTTSSPRSPACGGSWPTAGWPAVPPCCGCSPTSGASRSRAHDIISCPQGVSATSRDWCWAGGRSRIWRHGRTAASRCSARRGARRSALERWPGGGGVSAPPGNLVHRPERSGPAPDERDARGGFALARVLRLPSPAGARHRSAVYEELNPW